LPLKGGDYGDDGDGRVDPIPSSPAIVADIVSRSPLLRFSILPA